MSSLPRLLPIAALSLLSMHAPALAQQSGYGEVTCSSSRQEGNVTTCEGHHTITLTSEGVGTIYGIRVTAPTTHCSPVGYGVVRYPYQTGADVVGQSAILAAGESGWFEVGRDFAAGTHELRIIATGVVTGCNTGQMHSWGVNWELMIIPE